MTSSTQHKRRASQSCPVRWVKVKDIETIRSRNAWVQAFLLRKVFAFRQPQPFLTNTTTPSTLVDRGSLFGGPNHDQGYQQDSRNAGGNQPFHEHLAPCIVIHNDNAPLEPSAFQESATQNFSQGAVQEIDHNTYDHSAGAIAPPVTRQGPNDPRDVLKHLERHGRGRATCLWLREGNHELCGYTSQIDLVKRHIKRVHYRLRWFTSGPF